VHDRETDLSNRRERLRTEKRKLGRFIVGSSGKLEKKGAGKSKEQLKLHLGGVGKVPRA